MPRLRWGILFCMRILHLDSGREMRGGQWQVLRLHQGLLERGHDSVLLARAASPLLVAAKKEGHPGGILRPWDLGPKSTAFDIVHAHDAHSHTIGAIFSRRPLVVSRRVAFPIKDSVLSRWKYGRAWLFLAVSRFVADQLIHGGVSPDRVIVVYDGVPVPAEPAQGEVIVAPFSPDPQKGMALAREAARIAGVDIVFSENLDRDLSRARALLYLTQSEGLGSGILLGMAHGLTVIASRVGGIPEIIENGVNGLLVENIPEAVAGALCAINSALGVAARSRVSECFTADKMIEATLLAYQQVLDRA